MELKTDNQSGGGLKGSYSFEDGRLLICVYNLDGHYVGALIDNENQREAIEKELQAVMPDVRRAAAKVAAGWIIPGCTATRRSTAKATASKRQPTSSRPRRSKSSWIRKRSK